MAQRTSMTTIARLSDDASSVPAWQYPLVAVRKLRVRFAMVMLLSAWPVVGAIRGTVVRPDGTAVVNARVVALRPAATTGLEMILSAEPEKPLATAGTDAKGAFTINMEGPGLVRLHVDADGFAPLDALVERDESAGRLGLRAAPVVEGHVRFGGKPVVGAEVIVVGVNGVPWRYTTDWNGLYRVPDPKVWARVIVVRHRNYAPAISPPMQRDFALGSGRLIEGRVV